MFLSALPKLLNDLEEETGGEMLYFFLIVVNGIRASACFGRAFLKGPFKALLTCSQHLKRNAKRLFLFLSLKGSGKGAFYF